MRQIQIQITFSSLQGSEEAGRAKSIETNCKVLRDKQIARLGPNWTQIERPPLSPAASIMII